MLVVFVYHSIESICLNSEQMPPSTNPRKRSFDDEIGVSSSISRVQNSKSPDRSSDILEEGSMEMDKKRKIVLLAPVRFYLFDFSFATFFYLFGCWSVLPVLVLLLLLPYLLFIFYYYNYFCFILSILSS